VVAHTPFTLLTLKEIALKTVARLSCLLSLLAIAFSAAAQTSCKGELRVNAKSYLLSHCALAVMPMDGKHSVTLLAQADPIPAAAADTFRMSAYSSLTNAERAPITALMISFCAGGSAPSVAAATSFQTSISVAGAPLLSRERSLPDAEGRVQLQRLGGALTAGQLFSGAVTGAIKDSDQFALTLEWRLTVPTQEAASGVSCP
jgi:hypothetical protein